MARPGFRRPRAHRRGVKEALLLQPNISANEFRRFVEGRARAIQNIAAFLVANMPFTEEEDSATRVGELAANTLAYHLAGATKREQLVGVFQAIAASILDHTDGPQRAIIRRSPLPPAAVADLQAWLTRISGIGDSRCGGRRIGCSVQRRTRSLPTPRHDRSAASPTRMSFR